MKYQIGQWVRSARVGSKGSFVGKIVSSKKYVVHEGEYIVEDAEKRKWLRHQDELSPAADKREKAA